MQRYSTDDCSLKKDCFSINLDTNCNQVCLIDTYICWQYSDIEKAVCEGLASLKRFLLQHVRDWHFGQFVIAKQLEVPSDINWLLLRHLYPCVCHET